MSRNATARKSPPKTSTQGHQRSDPTKRIQLRAIDSPRVWSLGALGVFAFIMLFGALLGAVVVQTGVVQHQVEKDELADRIAEQSEMQDRLSLEVSRLEAPQRILSEARERLGMVAPDNRPYLPPVVPDDPSTPVPLPPVSPFGPSE